MRALWLSLVLSPLLVVACGAARQPDAPQGPGLVFPARFAEGNNAEAKPRSQPQPDADAGSEPKGPVGSQPDPEPLRQPRQYEYQLTYDRGSVSVGSVRAVTFAQPVVTARRMGRFAIELWIGSELVDRVRFDFPLTAADEPPRAGPKPFDAPPDLGKGVSVTQMVLVPAAERARRALLVDRATGSIQELPWPPDRAPVPLKSSDAGAPPANEGELPKP